ncbi:hypothetical protein, partial [Paenibacillus sonchi]|uniref:hypothetical protein n=1 Tax=Paenibacillus sonchi TaxID=373687 RepID=UPI001AE06233
MPACWRAGGGINYTSDGVACILRAGGGIIATLAGVGSAWRAGGGNNGILAVIERHGAASSGCALAPRSCLKGTPPPAACLGRFAPPLRFAAGMTRA